MGKWHDFLTQNSPYALYVLFMMLLTYLLNQVDRYTLAVVSKELEVEVGFGDREGKGEEYQLLAGPVFTVIYTFMGVPVGYFADRYNRVRILCCALVLWSVCTAAFGISHEYWQVVLARAGQGLGEAACTPAANGILSEYFSPSMRGTALGIYNWGIYTGYSLALGAGGAISSAIGYRYVFIIFGLAGIPVAIIMWLTVREPARGVFDEKKNIQPYSVKEVLLAFWNRKSLLCLCIAGAVRNAGGYVWAYNTYPFFEDTHDLSKNHIAEYMGWIPLVGGSLGATFGGFIADRLIKGRGSYARIWVLVFSQLAAAPFAAGALLLPTPWAFISLIPSNVIGEMWVGVTLAVVVELVTPGMRITAVAVYFFIISNIGGIMPLAVSPLSNYTSQRVALLILFPGLYLLSSVMFLGTLFVLKNDLTTAQKLAEEEQMLLADPSDYKATSNSESPDEV